MVKNSRTGLMVGLALVAGVAAGAIGMMSLRGGDGPYAASPAPAARTMGAAPASTAFVTAVAGNCEMNPVLPKAGSGDGSEALQAKPGTSGASEVASLILSGKEASAAGRQRDAEIDFLNACRNAAQLQDGDPIPLADSMYQLGRHYANVAALGGASDKELFQRAERLYSASLEAYRARYGEDSEKARFAREGLVTVQQVTGGKAPTRIAKAAPPAPVAAASAAVAVTNSPAATSAVTTAAGAMDATAPAAALAAAPGAQPASAPQVSAKLDLPRSATAPTRTAAVPRARVRKPPESPSRSDESVTPRTAPDTIEVRNSPPEIALDPGQVAGDDAPAPRRARPVLQYPRESQQDAQPFDTGTAGGTPTAQGSPDAP